MQYAGPLIFILLVTTLTLSVLYTRAIISNTKTLQTIMDFVAREYILKDPVFVARLRNLINNCK